MKHLNQKSTHIFLKLVKKLGTHEYLKIEVKEFMPLSIELLQNVETSFGMGKLYSLAHTFEQNGDLMRDPEMCFILVDASETSPVLIFPQMYQMDSLGLFEESVHIREGKVINILPIWQQSHCGFANIWLQNILAQGFLK